MSALVIAEHNNHTLCQSTLSTIQAAMQLQVRVAVVVIGSQCRMVAEEVASYEGLEEVILIDDVVYAHQLAENIAVVIADLAVHYTHLLAPAGTFGKNLLPRIAGRLGVGQISDIIAIVDRTTFLRPIYAGNAIAKVVSLDEMICLTVRTTVFAPVTKAVRSAPIRTEMKVVANSHTRFSSKELTKSDRPDLMMAKIVVAGGRGLQDIDNFKRLEQLASQLDAAVGASRAAVDAGLAPNDYQIGQTGKVVAPDLYLAIGISGASQHIAGMKESKVIVAINKDPEAPIFSVADYGIVGDLFTLLPQLQQALLTLGYT